MSEPRDQVDLFGPPQPLPELQSGEPEGALHPAVDVLAEVPLLEALPRRHGSRGTLTQRPLGMPIPTWHSYLKWRATWKGQQPTPAQLLEFLETNLRSSRALRRNKLVVVSEAPQEEPVWVTIKAWKDLTAAEEADWKRRIRMGQTDGIYKVSLRGLQKLEKRRHG